jgi:hypothetical protein
MNSIRLYSSPAGKDRSRRSPASIVHEDRSRRSSPRIENAEGKRRRRFGLQPRVAAKRKPWVHDRIPRTTPTGLRLECHGGAARKKRHNPVGVTVLRRPPTQGSPPRRTTLGLEPATPLGFLQRNAYRSTTSTLEATNHAKLDSPFGPIPKSMGRPDATRRGDDRMHVLPPAYIIRRINR